MRAIFAATMAASLVIFVCLTGCKPQDGSANEAPPRQEARLVNVSIQTVEPVSLQDVLVLPGETEAYDDVRVSADTAGVVERIKVQEGGAVTRGRILATIETEALKAALDQATAAHDLAEGVYQRRKSLFDQNIGTKEDLDRAETGLANAKGDLRRAEIELARGLARSPVDGRVDHLYVDQGEFVQRGDPLADIVNVDRIKVNVNVPEMDIRFIRPGAETAVTIDALGGAGMQGKVEHVAYKADPATKTFAVRVVVDNPDHAVRPGMIARVAFLRRIIENALVAPLFALVDKSGERMVFVEKDGLAHGRAIVPGVIDGARIQVLSGLEPGDRLIVAGQKDVEEGMRVNVQ